MHARVRACVRALRGRSSDGVEQQRTVGIQAAAAEAMCRHVINAQVRVLAHGVGAWSQSPSPPPHSFQTGVGPLPERTVVRMPGVLPRGRGLHGGLVGAWDCLFHTQRLRP